MNGWAQSYVEKRVTNSLIKHLGSMHAVEPLAAEPKAIVGAGAGEQEEESGRSRRTAL